MARNGSGTYSVVNTFVSGNTITASSHNANWTDIGSEMTNSVAADGQTTMTGPLKLSNGTAVAPALTFGSDTNHGLYRIGADNLGVTLAGSKVGDWSTTGLSITGTLTTSGALTVTANGLTVTAGGLTVTAGGETITAGGLTLSADTIIVPTGAVGAPTYSFASDSDTGIYRIGANNIGVTVAGAKEIDIAATGTTFTHAVTVGSGFTVSGGSVTLPAGSVANAALAAPGGLVRISSVSANNTSTEIHITSGITSTYRSYIFEIDNLLHATDAQTYLFQVSDDGGSTYKTSGYLSSLWGINSGAGSAIANATGGIVMYSAATTGSNTTANGGWSGTITIHNPAGTASYKPIKTHGAFIASAGSHQGINGSGYYTGNTSAITAVRILSSSGNIVSGKMTMYGMTDS